VSLVSLSRCANCDQVHRHLSYRSSSVSIGLQKNVKVQSDFEGITTIEKDFSGSPGV